MATCRLNIQLDEPKRKYQNGEVVSGNVTVEADGDVRCKGLKITSQWSTHGRGNVTQGTAESVVVFDGEWSSGKKYTYPFKLSTSAWPPTYHGHLINVSHQILAQASVPWATDPKALAEYVVVANQSPTDGMPEKKPQPKSWGALLLVPIAVVFLLMFIPLFLILLPILLVVGAVIWVVKVVIPGRVTGKVNFTTDTMVVAGESLKGSCVFTPQSSTSINGITWTIKCIEKCVSGSGTKRTTHSHEVYQKKMELEPASQLAAGDKKDFKLMFDVPAIAPPSMKLSDNEITWVSEFRVDIPKWPDWSKVIPFAVKPIFLKSSEMADSDADGSAPVDAGTQRANRIEGTPTSEEDPWLVEVFEQILQSADEPERLAKVIEAVGQQVFAIVLNLQYQMEEPIFDDDNADTDRDGQWLTAVYQHSEIQIGMFVPADASTVALPLTNNWQGNVNVVGFDDESRRILLKLV
jgi:hypothetical protein